MTEYERLRYNVYKTYPYAVMAGIVMRDIDSAMLVMKSKSAKQLYKQKKEKELMRQYRGELEDLRMTQGKILVKEHTLVVTKPIISTLLYISTYLFRKPQVKKLVRERGLVVTYHILFIYLFRKPQVKRLEKERGPVVT